VKDKSRNNIIILIFIHLLLITYPLVSKTIHGHLEVNFAHEFSNNLLFEQTEDSCSVCNFEFYSFIASNSLITTVYVQTFPVINTPLTQIHVGKIINYFSLRAPPIA